MFKAPLDLSKARILIANDDGIGMPGIRILEDIARTLSDDVWVVAPHSEQSASGHSLTLRRPLRIHQQDETHFSVDGTPTDAVLLALNEVLKDHKPDLVLSGINRGANMGEDITYSGTVAAAMEATLLGVPAIAFSQYYIDAHEINWDASIDHGATVLQKLAHTGWPKNTFMNVNFPDSSQQTVQGMKITTQGRRKIGDNLAKGVDPRGEPYYWIGALRTQNTFEEGSDLHAVVNGSISITPVSLDFCDHATVAKLRDSWT